MPLLNQDSWGINYKIYIATMRTVEQLLVSPPSSFNRAEWGLLFLEGKVNGY